MCESRPERSELMHQEGLALHRSFWSFLSIAGAFILNVNVLASVPAVAESFPFYDPFSLEVDDCTACANNRDRILADIDNILIRQDLAKCCDDAGGMSDYDEGKCYSRGSTTGPDTVNRPQFRACRKAALDRHDDEYDKAEINYQWCMVKCSALL